MNEEELAALAEKLYAQGLDDATVDMHLSRALMGSGKDASGNGIASYLMGLSSSAIGSATGAVDPENKAMGSPQMRAGAQRVADDQKQAADFLANQNPGAFFGGQLTPLALDLAAGAAPVVRKTGRLVGALGKGVAKETRIGRGLLKGYEEYKAGAKVLPKAAPKAPAAPAAAPSDLPKGEVLKQALQAEIKSGMRGPKGGMGYSNKGANAIPTGTGTKLGNLSDEIAAARAFGNSDEQIAAALYRRGIPANEVRKALGI